MSSGDRPRYEVLFESVEGMFKVLAEGQGELVVRMERVEGRLDRLETRVGSLEVKTDVVANRVESLASKVESLDSKVESLESKTDVVVEDVADVKERVVRIEKHLGLNGAPTKKARKRSKRAA